LVLAPCVFADRCRRFGETCLSSSSTCKYIRRQNRRPLQQQGRNSFKVT
jgi:hypothetical protein